MLQRLILKITKFQLPPPKRLSTVVKNILGAIMPPPMSNRVKDTPLRHFTSHISSLYSNLLPWQQNYASYLGEFGYKEKLRSVICKDIELKFGMETIGRPSPKSKVGF